jgi:hypothetical protein
MTMTTMPTTGRNEAGIGQAERTSQSLLQGKGHLHEGPPEVSVAGVQEAVNRLPSLTGTRRLPDFR